MNAEEEIKEIIKKKGRITFRDFMEISLKHYYEKASIGIKGDYYTAPYLTDFFGKCIAEQIIEMCEPFKRVRIAELGAGEGLLAKQITDYLEEKGMDYEYIIVEKSISMINKQKKILKGKNVLWADIEEIKNFEGVFLSNEFFDALPVHVVEKVGDEFREVYVVYKDRRFLEELGEVSRKEIFDYMERLKMDFPEDHRVEICLDALDYMRKISKSLKKGYVITIDYGYDAEEFCREYRKKGTITCYYKHRVSFNPYENIGEQDITAHVNFSALATFGKDYGLELTGFTTLTFFLLNVGMELLKNIRNYREVLKIKTLLLKIGDMQKVLVQHKNIEKKNLKCFREVPETIKKYKLVV